MTSVEVFRYLDSLANREVQLDAARLADFSLHPVEKLICSLGLRTPAVPVVHVAGSKGKGTTATVVSSVLRTAGYRVGLYTSPHFYSLNERIRILAPQEAMAAFSGSISDDDLADAVSVVAAHIATLTAQERAFSYTFFEVMTAAAVYYFAKKAVDVIVLETGLGGRLDATNAISSTVAAITGIGREHTAILGGTIEAIATEKAGIIKPMTEAVVLADMPEPALSVCKNRCVALGLTARRVGVDIEVCVREITAAGTLFDVLGTHGFYQGCLLPFLGEVFAHDAAVAVGIVEELEAFGIAVRPDDIKNGIHSVCWPGRTELITTRPAILLDCAHTVESVAALVKTVRCLWPKETVTVVVGCLRDKDVGGICRELATGAEHIIWCSVDHPRAYEPSIEELGTWFSGKNFYQARDIRDAHAWATAHTDAAGVVVVTGSLFLVGEMRKICVV